MACKIEAAQFYSVLCENYVSNAPKSIIRLSVTHLRIKGRFFSLLEDILYCYRLIVKLLLSNENNNAFLSKVLALKKILTKATLDGE